MPQLPDFQFARRGPFGDFALGGGRVFVRKTGNSAAIDARLLIEVAIWLAYYLAVCLHGVIAGRGAGRRRIWFTPDRPHPRYLIRTAMIWAGIRLARSAAEADAVFFFEDATISAPAAADRPRHFNFGCTDISKSHVAAVFEATFGYALAIDPMAWRGEAVEKGEANGTHDGRIITCPTPRVAGKSYQRLIDTIGEDGLACDLRTHCIGGTAVVVWVKRRAPEQRFLPPNLSAVMRRPDEIFSPIELERIGRFVTAMGADWCGIDILRDHDGRIYVVDVNKTDAGPIIALPFIEKLRSTAVLADRLLALIAWSRPKGDARP